MRLFRRPQCGFGEDACQTRIWGWGAGPHQDTVENVSTATATATAADAKTKVLPDLMGKIALGVAPSAPAPSASARSAPATSAPATSAAPALSASQTKAVSAAKGHLTVGQGFSYQGLIDHREFALCQQSDTGQAVYAVTQVGLSDRLPMLRGNLRATPWWLSSIAPLLPEATRSEPSGGEGGRVVRAGHGPGPSPLPRAPSGVPPHTCG